MATPGTATWRLLSIGLLLAAPLACKTAATGNTRLAAAGDGMAAKVPAEATKVCTSGNISVAMKNLSKPDQGIWASDGGAYLKATVLAAATNGKRFLLEMTNSSGGNEAAFFSIETQGGATHAMAYALANTSDLDPGSAAQVFFAGTIDPTQFDKVGDLVCVDTAAGASPISGNTSGVNLACKLPKSSELAKSGGDISLAISEVGVANPATIPAGVPSVFLDDIKEAGYTLREYRGNGSAKIKVNGNFIEESFNNRPFFGTFGQPVGSKRFAAYGDYAFKFPVIAVAGSLPRYTLYAQNTGGGAFDIILECTGDLPAVAAPVVAPVGPTYGLKFSCDITKRGQIPAIKVAFYVAGLPQGPAVKGATGEQIKGGGVDNHPISILNTGDELVARKVGDTLLLRADSDGVVEGRLELALPADGAVSTKGKFYYKSGDADGSSWANVACSLAPL